MVHVFTIVSCSHLADARVLMRSVAAHLPAARCTVFLTDDPAGRFDPAKEKFEVLAATVTALPHYRHCAFAFTAAELCFVLKPFCASFLLDRDAPDILLYLDADTLLLAAPTELLDTATRHGLALTPHLIDPARNARTALPTMRSGVINGGVFAIDRGRLARAFLDWWGRQLAEPANISPDWNHDQGWLALVPALFPAYGLLRHPGYNVAFWNLHERDVTTGPQGSLLASGLPLTLFHFSYFDPAHTEKITGRVQMDFPPPNATVFRLLADYAARLRENGYDECRRWTYGHGTFADGKPIAPACRAYFKARFFCDLPESANPFDPALHVLGHRGLKSLYHADHFLPRTARALRAFTQAFHA